MRRGTLFLISMLCCALLVGCSFEHKGPSWCPMDYPENIVGENSVMVIDSTIEDGKIVVVIQMNFEDFTLDDLLSIAVYKSEVGYENIACNVEESRKLNEADIFGTPYVGEASLVFTDDSISATHELVDYTMYLDYDNGNGTLSTHRFMIGRFPDREVTDISDSAFTTDVDEKDKKYYDYLEEKLEKYLGATDNVGDVAVDICMKEDTGEVDSVLVIYESKKPLSDKELQRWEDFICVQLGNEQLDVQFEQK